MPHYVKVIIVHLVITLEGFLFCKIPIFLFVTFTVVAVAVISITAVDPVGQTDVETSRQFVLGHER